MRRLDLTGKRFGKLVVLEYNHSHIQPSKQKRAMWRCICDCGTEKIISTANLTGGGTLSCGCYIKELRSSGKLNTVEYGEANFNYKYLSYKHRAKKHKKNLDFTLTKEQFRDIILNDCFYCGSKPTMHHTKRSYNGLFISNGIDRLDSNLGYTLDNSVPCCSICNMMKNNLSKEDFISHIERIYTYVKKRK